LDCDFTVHEQLMSFSSSISFRCLCILCKIFFKYLSHLSYMWIAFWSSYSCYSMECSSWVVHQHHVISILSLDWLSWLVKCAVAGLMLHCIFALQHISWELQYCAVDNWRLSDQHNMFQWSLPLSFTLVCCE
jgi:hypothetical protein